MPLPGSITSSIIIPVRNRPAELRRCLQSVRQSTLRDYELIVVDDASDDSTAEVANELGAQVVPLPSRSGPAVARNRGAQEAQSDILVFLDSDVCVHPDTLDRLIQTLVDDPEIDAVFGSYDAHPSAPNLVSQFRNLLHHYVHQTGHREASTFWAGCGAVRRSTFFEHGGFSSMFDRPCIEDVELGMRIKQAGGRIVLDGQIQATHGKRWTLPTMILGDVLDRGVPWTRLILSTRSLPNDLNLKVSQRLSAVLALALPGAISGGICGWPVWVYLPLVVLSLAGTILLNLGWYHFLVQQRGVLFAALTVPLHVLYYLYSSAAFALGVVAHLCRRRQKRDSRHVPARADW